MKQRKKKRPLYLILFLFFFAILVVLFFQSSISRIDVVTVSGADRLSKDEVITLSQVKLGEQLLLLSSSKVEERLSQNPIIKKSKVHTQFPGKVFIDITEYRTIGYLMSNNMLKPILENGTLLDKEPRKMLSEPIITEWTKLESLPSFCKELAHLDPSILQEISEIRLTPTENDPFKLTLYMRDGYEVHTSTIGFADQVKNYPYIVDNLKEEEPGIINLTDAGVYFISYQELQASLAEENNKSDEEETKKQ